jgi:hypothetical protein
MGKDGPAPCFGVGRFFFAAMGPRGPRQPHHSVGFNTLRPALSLFGVWPYPQFHLHSPRTAFSALPASPAMPPLRWQVIIPQQYKSKPAAVLLPARKIPMVESKRILSAGGLYICYLPANIFRHPPPKKNNFGTLPTPPRPAPQVRSLKRSQMFLCAASWPQTF